jgi:hypothetical protein
MTPINTITSTAAPLPLPNIDTDQIIPKQFLKRIERTGYGDFLFYDHRYLFDAAGHPTPNPAFVRQLPRARRLGHQPIRLPRHHRPHLRRHLLLQRRQERPHPLPPHRSRNRNPHPAQHRQPRPPHHHLARSPNRHRRRRLPRHLRHRPLPQTLPPQRPRRHRTNPPPRRRPQRLRNQTQHRILAITKIPTRHLVFRRHPERSEGPRILLSSAKGATYTSLGRSPRYRHTKSQRAEGPRYKSLEQHGSDHAKHLNLGLRTQR